MSHACVIQPPANRMTSQLSILLFCVCALGSTICRPINDEIRSELSVPHAQNNH